MYNTHAPYIGNAWRSYDTNQHIVSNLQLQCHKTYHYEFPIYIFYFDT